MNDAKLKEREIRISKMIMIIVGIFVSAQSFPIMGYSVTAAYGYTFDSYMLFLLSHFFIGMSSSVNVVIYGIFNKKYRIMFLKYFCCKVTKNENDSCRTSMSVRKISTISVTERNSQFNPSKGSIECLEP